jgi:dTDP-4-dehydrorhamnose reductase
MLTAGAGEARPLRVLVTGAGGQLGQELVRLPAEGAEVIGLSRAELDVADPHRCEEAVAGWRPDAVIHAAAYTAVDRAEAEPKEAYRVNAAGTGHMAAAAARAGAKFIYVSTDYVFDGTQRTPYRETDAPNPQTVYGRTKLEGERLVRAASDRWFIVRTSWVYGKYGGNFVHTMLKLADEKREIAVVCDQIGSPTYAKDLAAFLLRLVRTEKYGIFHASNAGCCSWYDFACAIMEESGQAASIRPCTTDRYPRPAPRPAYSVLDHQAALANGFPPFRPWREALRDFLRS